MIEISSVCMSRNSNNKQVKFTPKAFFQNVLRGHKFSHVKSLYPLLKL